MAISGGTNNEPWPPTEDELPPYERTMLQDALAAAERAPVSSLVGTVLAHLNDANGRDLELSAWMLAWSLAKDASGLVEIDRAIREHPDRKPLVRTLLLIVGSAGTSEARNWLLRMLDDASMAAFELDALESLHQAPVADIEVISDLFHQYKRDEGKPWPPGYQSSIWPSTDSDIVKATIRRVVEPGSEEVRYRAATLVEGLSNPTKRNAQIDEQTRLALDAAFLGILRESKERRWFEIAAHYLAYEKRPDIAAALWEKFSQQDPRSLDRLVFAGPVALQAQSSADVHRIIQVASREPAVQVRESMLRGLVDYLKSSASDKPALAEALAGWAKTDSEERLRVAAVEVLARMLPDSARQLDWARADSSTAVRTKLQEVLQRANQRGPQESH